MADLPEPVFVNEGVMFRVQWNGKVLKMWISAEALQDHFEAGDDKDSLIEAYRKNAERIDKKAIQWQAVNPTLQVILGTGDFR